MSCLDAQFGGPKLRLDVSGLEEVGVPFFAVLADQWHFLSKLGATLMLYLVWFVALEQAGGMWTLYDANVLHSNIEVGQAELVWTQGLLPI